MILHQLKLASFPFESIKSGRKTIESRLYDEKRREINLGDEIEFINRETDEILKTKVIGLHRYSNFETMFNSMGHERFGGESTNWLLKQIYEFYSKEDEDKFGVIGIEISKLEVF